MEKKIKKIVITRKDLVLQNINSNELSEVTRPHLSQEYDPENHLIEEIVFNREGDIEQIQRYVYHDNKLMEELSLDENNEVVERKTYEYSDQGILQKEFIHYSDGFFDTLTYYYDEKGQVSKKILIDSDEEPESVEIFEYKEKNLISHQIFDGNENLLFKKTQAFNDNNNPIEIIEEDLETGSYFKKTYEYDNEGHQLENQTFNKKDDLIERAVFFYNEKGNLTEVIEENQKGKNHTFMEYDEKGNLLYQEEKNSDDILKGRVERTYNEDNLVVESHVYSHHYGLGPDINYLISYTYEFH
ncbi:MAG: hypothetical protein GX587_10425 [Bacteroidales bacterium]|nr:hypothetical protein [Bacteroidales bacterium]